MAFKFIVAIAFVAVAGAGVLHAPQDYHGASQGIALAQPILGKAVESYNPHPRYQFSYSVNDEHTGDVKSQVETRDGDLVQGEYSLIDSDGYKRTVQYTADHDHGFNAVVHREPLGYAVKTAPVVKSAQVAYSAPAVIKSAPLAYAAAPAVIKSTYASAPAAYTSQSIVKSSPVAYAAAPSLSYDNAPAAYATQLVSKNSHESYVDLPYSYEH